jgi:hypothetical protein
VRPWFFLICLILLSLSLPVQGQTRFVRPLISQPVNEKQLTALKNSAPALARPEFDHGAAPADLPMDRMLLVLKRSPEQQAGLTKLLDDQQDRSSANYHKWLTPEQFGEQFGASDEDIQSVTSWLQSHGLQINEVSKGRSIIQFSGTAAQVGETFHTQIHNFVVNGESHWANTGDVEIPTALVPAVAGPWSLHSFRKQPQLSSAKQKFEAIYKPGKRPEFTASNGLHALFPGDYAAIYNINPVYQSGINGSGVNIAIVGRTDIDFSDPSQFWNISGIGNFSNIVNNGPDPGFLSADEQFEATLDVSWAGATAPGAQRQFVISASTNTTDGVDLSELYIVDHNLADVMTESFGSCEGHFTQQESDGVAALAQQAAAQGITYVVSSGDSGASGCDLPTQTQATHGLSVSLLSSTPYNVAVGGTMFNENGQNSTYWSGTNSSNLASALSYIRENVWNESCSSQCSNPGLWATGGGVSTFFGKPSWQAGVAGIPADGKRDVPDISLTAAGHDPYLLCFQRSCVPDSQGFINFFGVSGTSASAPAFAGIMALVVQKTGSRQGQANYVLYKLAAAQNYSQCNGSSTTGTPAAACVFQDVTVGNNAVPGQTSQQYPSSAGYDLATGLGSPNVANLVNNWNAVAFTATTTTLALNPTNGIPHGTLVNVNIGVAPTSGTGTPTGSVSLLTSSGLGVQAFTLTAGSASSVTSDLPGGTYNIKAHYPGDGTFGASDSADVPLKITAEPSTTSLTLLTADPNGNPIPFSGGEYGNFIFPHADVAGQSGHGTPSGSVTFQDSLSTINFGSANLNSAGNTSLPNGLTSVPPGQHSVTALYSGDSSFSQSTSTAANFTITPGPTSISVFSDTSMTVSGANVTLSDNITTNSFSQAGLRGTVTFFSGTTALGNNPVFSTMDPQTGKAVATSFTFPTSSLPIGQNSITAQYSGDSNYTGSTSTAITVTITPDFSPSLSSSSANILAGQSATSSLLLAEAPGFSGIVNFSCANLPSKTTCSFSPPALPAAGSTTLTITTTPTIVGATSHGQSRYLAWWTSGGLPLAGFLLIGTPKRRRRNRWAGIAAFGLLAMCLGCGGGSGSGSGGGGGSVPGTPSGTYSILINATSGNITRQTTFTLKVL